MSDYMFVLESHLDAAQNRVVAEVQRIATEAGTNVWLTGGAMRDTLRGARILDLDFTVERDALKVGKSLAQSLGGQVLVEDSLKGVSEVVGTGGEEIKKGLRIEFRGEEGIDAGGLRKEWFLLLVRDVFNPEHGMVSHSK